MTGVCTDVTDRVRNEQQLGRGLAQHRALARFGSFAPGDVDLQQVMDEAVAVAAAVLDVWHRRPVRKRAFQDHTRRPAADVSGRGAEASRRADNR